MIDYEQLGRDVVVSYVKEEGNIALVKIPIPQEHFYNWKACGKDDPAASRTVTTFDGRPVKKVKSHRLDKYRLMEMMHLLSDEFKDKIHSVHQPKKVFMDIETEILTKAIPSADNPMEAVLTNSWVEGNKVTMQGFKKLDQSDIEAIKNMINDHVKALNTSYEVEYLYYTDERAMLRDLFEVHLPRMMFVTGWNFLKFDWNYMSARAKFLGININKVSPTGRSYSYYIRDKFSKEKAGTTVYLPKHKIVVDYMMLYENIDKSVKVKESSQLDWVGKEVLNIPKVSYNGNLMDLYRDDYKRYLFYNVVDCILVKELDAKLQTFSTMMTLGSKGKVPLHEATFASDIVENLFCEEYLSRNMVFVDERKQASTDQSYSGGYVKEPAPGIHTGVAGLDYESLFPSLMLAFNTGLDTYMGHTHDRGQTFISINDGSTNKFDSKTMTWCESGAVYSKAGDSVMKTVIVDLFKARVEAKHYANELDEDIEKLERMLKQAS